MGFVDSNDVDTISGERFSDCALIESRPLRSTIMKGKTYLEAT